MKFAGSSTASRLSVIGQASKTTISRVFRKEAGLTFVHGELRGIGTRFLENRRLDHAGMYRGRKDVGVFDGEELDDLDLRELGRQV